jgi:hypothetical protein
VKSNRSASGLVLAEREAERRTLYLDASALVKRYVAEPPSHTVLVCGRGLAGGAGDVAVSLTGQSPLPLPVWSGSNP